MNHLPINYTHESGAQMMRSSQSIQERKDEPPDSQLMFVYPRSNALMHQMSQSTVTTFNSSSRDVNAHSLEAELIRLRESTKEALQQSWDEVENLQEQCSTHAEIITELENDVVESKKKEDIWHQRCLEAEKQLLQLQPIGDIRERAQNEGQDLIEQNPERNSTFMLSWKNKSEPNYSSPTSSKLTENIRNDSLENRLQNPFSSSIDNTLHTIGTHLSNFSLSRSQKMKPLSSHQLEAERNEREEVARLSALTSQLQEMEVKLSSRDEAIRSLERTADQHVKSMHNLQSEMECMLATQRIKEQTISSAIKGKEEHLNKRIASLQDDLVKKEKVVGSQRKKMKEYRDYIDELVQELERVARLIKNAEMRGIYIS